MKINNHISTLENTIDSNLRLHCELESGWYVETDHGTEFVASVCVSQDTPIDTDDCNETELIEIFGEFIEGSPWHCERVSMWRAYWTMPGYLDCGEPYCGETEIEALTALLDSLDPESDALPVWYMEALERCTAIRNDETAPTKCRQNAMETIMWHMPVTETNFNPHELGANYVGDMDPIDHNGNWFKTNEWNLYGYADCVNVVSAENKLWIEIGIINKHCDLPEKIDVPGVALLREIDHNFAQWGMETIKTCEYTRLNDSDWFVDSDDELISKSEIEQRLIELVNKFINTGD